MEFIGKIKVNKQNVVEIKDKRKSIKELDIELRRGLAIERIITTTGLPFKK